MRGKINNLVAVSLHIGKFESQLLNLVIQWFGQSIELGERAPAEEGGSGSFSL